MAYIKQISLHEATGKLKQVYDAGGARSGGVAKILQVMSRDARSLQSSMQFYVSLMKSPNALEPARREMLAAVVSNVNECFYWTLSHAKDFGLESKNESVAEQLIYDYREADLPPADRALCDYAVKLTLTPGKMGEADVEILHKHGFDDDQITIATQVISYFNYINRIADGLGVDNEPWMTLPHEEWKQKKGVDYGDA